MRTLAIRHVAFEDLGAWAAPLAAKGEVAWLEAGIDPYAGEADLLVILGGPIGVYELQTYPWLGAEIAFVRGRLERGLPTLGVCLGAQIMAAAQGARVYAAGVKEIGFMPIELSAAGKASCLAPFAAAPAALHWHGDTFDLPAGATLLASTAAVRNQAFALGRGQLGVQFHPEADLAAFERWLIGHAVELAAAGADIAAMRAAAQGLRGELKDKAERVLAAFLEAAGL